MSDRRLDAPLVMLRLAVQTMPPDRQAWGDAMLAELEVVEAQGARWRFLGLRPTSVSSTNTTSPTAGSTMSG